MVRKLAISVLLLGMVGVKNTLKNNWQRRDLNPRPKAYESLGAATIT